MKKETKERLDEIREQIEKLKEEESLIVYRDIDERKKKLYKKIIEITKKKVIDIEDLKYIEECSHEPIFSCHNDIMNITLNETETYLIGDEITISHEEKGPDYEGSWGDIENDTISDFDYFFKIEKPLKITYNKRNKQIAVTLQEVKEGYTILIYTLDEDRMQKIENKELFNEKV